VLAVRLSSSARVSHHLSCTIVSTDISVDTQILAHPFTRVMLLLFQPKKILPMVVGGVVGAICYPQGCSAPFVLCHSWWTPILRPVSPLLCAPFDVCSTVPFLLLIHIVRFSLDFRSGFV